MDTILAFTNFIAHFLIGLFFLLFGIYNLFNWKKHSAALARQDIPSATLVIFIAGMWQAIAGFMIITYWCASLAALSLIIFVIIVLMVFHCYWFIAGEKKSYYVPVFMGSLITLGALLLLLN